MLFNYQGAVTRVIDADTLVVDVDLGFQIHFTTTVRLLGVDCHEPRGVNRDKAMIAKDAVDELLRAGGYHVRIETIKDRTGKYGRYLARVWVNDINLNNWLVENGHTK